MKNRLTVIFAALICSIVLTAAESFSQPYDRGAHPVLPAYGFVTLITGESMMGTITSKKMVEGMTYIAGITFDGPREKNVSYDASIIQRFGILAFFNEEDHKYTSLSVPMREQGFSFVIYEPRPSPKSGNLVFMFKITKGRIAIFQNPSSAFTFSGGSTVTQSILKSVKPSLDVEIDPSVEVNTQDGNTSVSVEVVKTNFSMNPTYDVTVKKSAANSWYSSYYFEKDNGELIKIEKKNYDALWPELFGDCPLVEEAVSMDPELKKFKNFVKLVDAYNQSCNKL